MAISVGQPMDEITRRLDGLKLVAEDANNEQHKKFLPFSNVHPEVEGSLSVYPSERSMHPTTVDAGKELSRHPSFVEHINIHPPFDPTTLDAGKQLSQHSVSFAPNVLISPQELTFTGYPVPILNFPGYLPYPIGGVFYSNPVGQGTSVHNNGYLYPVQGTPNSQVLYPQYPVFSGGHYTVAAPVIPEASTMIPGVPNSGSFMPYVYLQNPHGGHTAPMASVEASTWYNSTTAGMPDPIWVQQLMYSKVAPYDGNLVLSQYTNHGIVLNDFVPAMKQLPYVGMPHYGAWHQGQWQCVNVVEPLKASISKAKSPLILDVISRTTHSLPTFSIDFDDAKHFIIKSFSEENVCKSIEHGVWASTSNGNKKLDEAFQDAQCRSKGKAKDCPVLLYFSVNGSGRFCGVAEMVGPVDYNNTKEFWERSRWCGSFPVKWRMIKDVPNSQLRGIVLKDNENKPVTSSRDTQEVNYEEGMQILKIMKSYPKKASILDNHPSFREVIHEEKSQQMSPLESTEQPKRVSENPNKVLK